MLVGLEGLEGFGEGGVAIDAIVGDFEFCGCFGGAFLDLLPDGLEDH